MLHGLAGLALGARGGACSEASIRHARQRNLVSQPAITHRTLLLSLALRDHYRTVQVQHMLYVLASAADATLRCGVGESEWRIILYT